MINFPLQKHYDWDRSGSVFAVKPLKLYSIVKIIRLIRGADDYNGWNLNRESPKVGETGTIVEILYAKDLLDCYVVEKADLDGTTIWLSDFVEEELEPI
jgi:hypothetical protein